MLEGVVGLAFETLGSLQRISNGNRALRFVIPTAIAMGLSPTKVMKNASVQQPRSMEPSPFPLSSRVKPRDLQFHSTRNNSFWKSSLKWIFRRGCGFNAKTGWPFLAEPPPLFH
jgi:hypothetical protein